MKLLFGIALLQSGILAAQQLHMLSAPLLHAFIQLAVLLPILPGALAELDRRERIDLQTFLNIEHGIMLQTAHQYLTLQDAVFSLDLVQTLKKPYDHSGLAGARRALNDRDIRCVHGNLDRLLLVLCGRIARKHLFQHTAGKRCNVRQISGKIPVQIRDALDNAAYIRVRSLSVQDPAAALFTAVDLLLITADGKTDHAAAQIHRRGLIRIICTGQRKSARISVNTTDLQGDLPPAFGRSLLRCADVFLFFICLPCQALVL